MKQALEMALEALENSVDLVVNDAYNAEQLYGNYPTRQGKVGGLKVLAEQHKQAITAIKEALAQPEQKPVAYIHRNEFNEYRLEPTDKFKITDLPVGVEMMLYTTPPQRTWVGLTHEEITTTSKETHFEPKPVTAFARAIEAKLKEKNNG